MKKVLKILGITVGALIVLAAGLYLIIIKPIIEEEDSLKPVLLNAVNDLLNCSFNSKDIETCYNQKTTKAFQNVMPFDQYTISINKVKKTLGNRLSSELIKEKFNLTVVKGPESGKRVNFIVKAAYQNDLFATETYVYVQDENSKEYKLNSIMFNSNKLIE